MKPLVAPRPQDYHKGNVNDADSDGRLVLPPLQPGHKFVVTSILMEILTVRGLFFGKSIGKP